MDLSGVASMGNQFTSTPHRKSEPILLTFEDQVIKREKKRPTFTRKYFPWVRIDELKKDLAKNFYNNKIQWDQLRLFCKNIELENNHRFFDYNVEPQNNIIIQKIQNIDAPENGIINPYKIFQHTPKEITDLIMSVESGLNAGRKPKLSEEGTSGTYFLQNHEKKKIAIFKPHDQQPFTPSNPRGYIGNLGGNGIRKGILSGQAATREVAAFLLDVNKFHKVPPTTYVEFYHPSFNYKQVINSLPIKSGTQTDLKTLKTKHGSLQEFVESHDVAGNLGSHQFDIEEVHKIGILDLRILNCDRNQANILIKKVNVTQTKTNKQYKKILMIPIDHGLCFPDNFQIYEYQMVWMSYPQSKRPFSPKSLEFIKNINSDEDCRLLREKLGFREICLRNFKIAQIFLKKMAAEGFTLYEIGSKVYRMDDDSDFSDSDNSEKEEEKSDKPSKKSTAENKSQLEKLVQRTEEIYNLVKQNGIKSTIQFQIGLIKMRRQQQSVSFLEQKRIQSFKLTEVQQELEDELNSPKKLPQGRKLESRQPEKRESKISQNTKHHLTVQEKKLLETSIEKMEHIQSIKKSLPKVRNVSLPHLKNPNRKQLAKKKRKLVQNSRHKNNNGWKKDETWEQIFFHYFEDLLDEYIKKLKAKNSLAVKPPQRGRLMSENIEL